MKAVVRHLRRHAPQTAAVLIVLSVYAFGRLETVGESEAAATARPYRFTRAALAEPDGPYREVRSVHPSLRRISGWISTVGAAVTLADLDGDGLPNDVCHVEPRTDEVLVSPVPGSPPRYEPFVLDPAPVPYDGATMAPMGCIAGDLNEDGLMDALVYYWGRPPIAFLRAATTSGEPLAALATAAYRAIDIVDPAQRWFTNAAVLADLDGDGHLDLLVGNYFNDGASILDANGTGVEEMHNTKSSASNGGHKHLLLWTAATSGPGARVEYREADGLGDAVRGWTLAIGAADLDGDLLPELYFAHDFGPDRLLHNRSTPGQPRFSPVQGRRGFRTPKSAVLGHDSFKGMGVDFGDVNGDGVLDISVTNIADDYALHESHFLWLSDGDAARALRGGAAPYVHGAERLGVARSGWGWDTRFGDFDNDGRLEILHATGFMRGTVNRWPELQALGTGNDQLMSNPALWPAFRAGDDVSGRNRFGFFAPTRGERFANVSDEIGLGEPMVSRGIATGDVDADGRLDFAVANQWSTSYFFRNVSPAAGRFLGLRLLLPAGAAGSAIRVDAACAPPACRARPAVGATAIVRAPGRPPLVGQVDASNGHSGRRSPDLHFGLGATAGAIDVELKWRDARGAVRHASVALAPGWHTVLLGSAQSEGGQ